MKYAIANLQRSVFTILLYASALYGTVADTLNLTSRTAFFAAWEGMIFFLALFSLSTVPKGYRLIMIFVIFGILFNLTYTTVPLTVSLNGMREILMVLFLPVFYFKVFAEGNEEEAMKYVRIFKKFAWFFLVVQIVPVLIQYKQFGATDYVGGTYGWFATGSLTLIIICMVFYLFQFPTASWQKLMLFVLMYPLMLNETKISFILIPMMVVFLFFEPKVKNVLLAGAGAALFLLVFNQLYSNDALNLDNSMMDIFNKDFLDEYLFADFETHPDVPRFTKIILGYNLLSLDARTLWFGMEYGMFRGSTTGDMSPFAQNYQWLLNGTRPYLFFIMMQGGLALIAGFFLIILRINNFFRRATKHTVFYFIIFLIVLTYQDMFRFHNFLICYMFVVFFINSELFKSKRYLDEYSYSVD